MHRLSYLHHNTDTIRTLTDNIYAYASANPLSFVDPLGLATTLITTYDYGIGSHSAMFISRAGTDNFLYNPAGSYDPGGTRGTGGFFMGDQAKLNAYVEYQKSLGSTVELLTLNTTEDQEQAIIDSAMEIGDPRGFGCASSVSSAFGGACRIKRTGFPGRLFRQANDSACKVK